MVSDRRHTYRARPISLFPAATVWVVSIGGDVIEAGRTSPAYRSAMLIVVEPFTGSVIVFGAG